MEAPRSASDLDIEDQTEAPVAEAAAQELRAFIRSVLAELAEVPEEDIDVERTHMGQHLEIDSLQQIELVGAVETRYGVDLPPKVWRDAYTVSTLAERVESVLAGRAM